MKQFLKHLTHLASKCFSTGGPLLKTALWDYHVSKLGAKMVEFTGYSMPVQYPLGVLNEHLFCRKSAGLFDVAHMGQIKIFGAKQLDFIETVVVGDIRNLKMGTSTLSLILNEKGGIIDDTIVTKLDDHIHLVVNAGNKLKDFAHFKKVAESKFKGEDLNVKYIEGQTLIALQGPKSAEAFQKIVDFDLKSVYFMDYFNCKVPQLDTTISVSRSGYTESIKKKGEDGFEFSIEDSKAEGIVDLLLQDELVKPIGLGARDSLRLEAGLCLHGNDIDESKTPNEGSLMWLVRKELGPTPYIGSEVVEQMKQDGEKERRVGYLATAKGIPRHGHDLFDNEGNKVGIVTSGTYSPILKKACGMAYVKFDFHKKGTELIAKLKHNDVPIVIAGMPFVGRTYYRRKK